MKLDFKDNNSNLRSSASSMMADECPLGEVLLWLQNPKSEFPASISSLKNKSIIITSIQRGYKPGYSTIYNVQKAIVADDSLRSLVRGVTLDPITLKAKFFGRENISENEWTYKIPIINEQYNQFVKYTPHFTIPGKNYGCGIDIRTSGVFKASEASLLVSAIKNRFGTIGIDAIYHTISGGSEHIHIEDEGTYHRVITQLKSEVNEACGYDKFIKENLLQGYVLPDAGNPRTVPMTPSECAYLVQTDLAEQTKEFPNKFVTVLEDGRDPLPDDIMDDGLMEVLKIGDLNFNICPVTQIGYSQSSQFIRFSALRTVGDPKIVSDTVPNNITVNIVFPNKQAINEQLRGLIAQFVLTPVTVVQSRFIASVLRPLNINHQDEMKENEIKTAVDQSLWMIMTDINIRSIQGFPEAMEVFLTLEYFEERVFGGKLSFLATSKDLLGKYQRKMSIMGSELILPSENRMIEMAKNFQEGLVITTPDPGASTLYKDFYGILKDKILEKYNPPENWNGKLSFIYNALNTSRKTVKEAEVQHEQALLASLETTVTLMKLAPEEFKNYLQSKDIVYLSGQDILAFARATAKTSIKVLETAFKHAAIVAQFHKLRFAGQDLILELQKLMKSNTKTLNQIASEFKLSPTDAQLLNLIMEKMITYASKFQVGDAITSIGKGNISQMWNPFASNPVDGEGLIGQLELFLGARLFGVTEDQIKSVLKDKPITPEQMRRISLILAALDKLVNQFLAQIQDPGNGKLTLQELYPQNFDVIEIANGHTCFCTGISFAMSNKIVPQQVIGWKQPTYQHLGRSDWTVNMTFVAHGDEPVKRIMYLMNKTGAVSKYIQMNSPTRFVNLETALVIQEGDPIFDTLGISKLMLSSAEISSIQGQPNTYQITLGFEQADLNVRTMEQITNQNWKDRDDQVKGILGNLLVPVLKALVVEGPDKGAFLNFEVIKEAVEDPELKTLWESKGVQEYDYMDKYYFLRIISQIKMTDPPLSSADIIKLIFSKIDSAKSFQFVEPKLRETQAWKNLAALFRNHGNGSLLHPTNRMLAPDKLTLSLEFYFEGLGQIIESYKNHITETFRQEKIKTYLKEIHRQGMPGPLLSPDAATGGMIGFGLMTTPDVADVTVNIKGEVQELIYQIFPKAFNLIIDNRLLEMAKDLVFNDDSLNLFIDGFQVDSSGATLRQKIDEVRSIYRSSIGSCYNDYKDILSVIAANSSVPLSMLDPACYLYAADFITSDLIRELQTDVGNRIHLLAARASVMALMVEGTIERIELNKGSIQTSGLINQDDLDWLKMTRDEIIKINNLASSTGSREDIEKAIDIQKDSEGARDLYFKHLSADARKNAIIEQAFARIVLIDEALRIDIIRSALTQSTDAIQMGYNLYHKMPDMDKNQQDRIGIDKIKAYKLLFDYDPTSDLGAYLKKSLYEALIEVGGMNTPYHKANSVNIYFQKATPEKLDIETYFGKFPELNELLQKIETVVRCKKAVNDPYSARMFAETNALQSDPRLYEKRLDEIGTMQDIILKASISDQTGNPIRIFPTFKIYFIEEDTPEWGIYHDFYDYSAVQEISVVKDRTAASDTCVIKLSNVTGKLTDSFADNMPEMGTRNLPMASMMLKPGTSILVKMGYSNSEVELPVVFYGIIIEVAPGPVVEIICQSYGAELNEVVASVGKHHGLFGDVKGLGDVATWALQQSTGMDHFGKLGFSDLGIHDTLRLSGNSLSGMQANLKIASFITKLPGLNYNDPRDDNVYLPYNMANITSKPIRGLVGSLIESVLESFRNPTNLNFDWYIRNQSIWSILEELTWFSPDFIHTVLPFNDNLFPLVPKIRQTIYVGPRRGYYKYTDIYSIAATTLETEEQVLEDAKQFVNLSLNLLRVLRPKIPAGKTPREIFYTWDDSVMSPVTELSDYLKSHQVMKQAVGMYFGIQVEPVVSLQAFDLAENEQMGIMMTILDAYARKFTNFLDLDPKGEVRPIMDLASILQKKITNDVGFSSMYYNLYGKNHQYKKVQNHYIVTSHTNLLNNNIIATADGWANRINLICPKDPTKYRDLEEMPVEDREDLIVTPLNLDDDIFDDQIRPKDVYVNNIDPSMYDDTAYGKRALSQEGSWITIIRDRCIGPDGIAKNISEVTKNINAVSRTWETLPSRWRVGISLLAKEARNMYNGDVTITGNSYIKPYDVVHLIDMTNGMDGSFEVGRVIHTLSPMTGFTTKIKPDLIVNQKNRFNADEICIASKMMHESFVRAMVQAGVGSLFLGIGGFVAQGAGMGFLTTLLSRLSFFTAFALVGYNGYKAIKNHHERIITIMNNTIGRDSLELMPLMYRNMPYVAGIDGVQKDSYLRHMHSAAIDDTGKVSIWERMGYANSPIEFEYYNKVVGDSGLASLMQTMLGFGFGPGAEGQGGPGMLEAMRRSF